MSSCSTSARAGTTRGRQQGYRVAAIVALALWWCDADRCFALMTASRPAVVNPNAAFDSSTAFDGIPAVAGASGVFVTVYESEDSLGGTIGDDFDILAVRSTDGGHTWSAAVPVNSSASSDGAVGDYAPSLSTDGQGTWTAVWKSSDGSGCLWSARSIDNGATWSERVLVAEKAYSPQVLSAQAVSIVVWHADDVGYGVDHDVFYARSTDGGLSWSAPLPLEPGAASDVGWDGDARVTTDGAGVWVAVWKEYETIRSVRSTDDGVSWNSPVPLGPIDFGVSEGIDIATDRNGRWIAVWGTQGTEGIAGISGGDTGIAYAVSTDAGISWSTPKALLPDEATDAAYEGSPRLTANGRGEFQVVWYQSALDSIGRTVGKDSDLFGSRSVDGGERWSGRALVNSNGSRDSSDAIDVDAAISADQAGNWVVVWNSTDPLNQTIGADLDVLSTASHDDCPVAPRVDCATASERGSRLTIKVGSGGRDRLLWTWSGAGTTAADLGNPTTGDGYMLCLYDKVGADFRAVFEMDALGAVTCNISGSPCWNATATGFHYKDSTNLNGATKTVSASATPDERGKFRLVGAGPTLSLPAIPLALSPQVQVQLINTGTDACWSATYSTAVRNDAGSFKAVAD